MDTKINKRHPIELADIFNQYGQKQYFSLCPQQQKAFRAITNCRTDRLGGHTYKCDQCGHTKTVYNSCRNRHCPKCQYIKQMQWVDKLKTSLPPTNYYHLVFTIPQALHKLFYINQGVCYGLLFKAAYRTLSNAAANPTFLGVETGCVAILHTWGQALTYHPHIHMIVPAGGISLDGIEWVPASRKFFLPIKALSRMFRGILCRMLEDNINNKEIYIPNDSHCFKDLKTDLYKKNWNVYCKKAFRGPAGVVEYLGRYTHRVAISNDRILSIANHSIRFRWKDYKVGDVNKIMALDAEEFIRRFMQHILPNGFYKIRYYGLFASVNAKTKRILLFQLLEVVSVTAIFNGLKETEIPQIITGTNLNQCPVCRKGNMEAVSYLLPKVYTPV
ncbi:IS91 family transposase [Bacteroidota bacterium]